MHILNEKKFVTKTPQGFERTEQNLKDPNCDKELHLNLNRNLSTDTIFFKEAISCKISSHLNFESSLNEEGK